MIRTPNHSKYVAIKINYLFELVKPLFLCSGLKIRQENKTFCYSVHYLGGPVHFNYARSSAQVRAEFTLLHIMPFVHC